MAYVFEPECSPLFFRRGADYYRREFVESKYDDVHGANRNKYAKEAPQMESLRVRYSPV